MARRIRRPGLLVGAAAAAALAFPAAASADPQSTINAGVLTVTGDADDAIAITCVANAVQVNGVTVGGGACDAITSIVATGGADANTIDLSAVTDADQDPAVVTDYPAITSVTIDGGGGPDAITGSEHTDTMRGGDGDDRIVGDENKAPGSFDVFEGQGGNDTLVWNPGQDSDKMDGGDGADTIEMNGGGGAEQFTVKPSATAGRVQFDRVNPAPFVLDIGTAERLDFNAGGGDDSLTSEAGLLALGFALDIDGGTGNDTLDGGDGNDLMHGGDGNDRIIPDDNPPLPGPRDEAYGDGGDDTIAWFGGDDDDLNEGGDGIDTIEVNGAALPEQFTVKPSPTAGRIAFDRLAAPGPGPFNIDIGTAERLDLNMAAGDDAVTADAGFAPTFKLDVEGGDGNDALDGGDAADLLVGGNGDDTITGDDNPDGTVDEARGDAGNDTMIWNPGDDSDLNEGGDGDDTAEVNGGGDERFTVKPGAAGRVAFDRTDPAPFSVDIGTTENLRLNAGDGKDRIKGAEGLAGLIKSTLNGDDGSDRVTGTDGEDRLSGGKGIDIINSRDKAEDTVDCAGGFDLALVDRRDFLRGCDVVLGGALRVKTIGKVADVAGGSAAMKLRCVATKRCKGKARLRRGGKTLAAGKFRMERGKNRTVRLKLNKRGRRALRKAPAKGLGAKLVIDSRDADGNGWRTTARVRIAD
jgi:Ca2+-binding RTX toxin-like protein